MKERPILMSASMVRALLAGTKTQTRRAIKAPSSITAFRHFDADTWDRMEGVHRGDAVRCPYGQPGDRLWVRESWMPDPPIDDTWASTQWAGCREGKIAGVPDRFRHPRFCNYAADWLHGAVIWTPSIHMPRWASRITLEVVGVRVERLQDINEADALAEGVMTWAEGACAAGNPCGLDAIGYYELLWSAINGRASWDANPWVWVVEFKRVEAA